MFLSDIWIERAEGRAGWKLKSTQLLPSPIEDVFPFFADAANLRQITPPWLHFEVLSPQPIEIRLGARIDYRLRVRLARLRWQSHITAWDPPHHFVDEQAHGPYRWWRHEHRFEPHSGGTLIRDDVHYGVPGGWLVHELLVRRDLKKIFAYRHQVLAERFG
jgi:ligand-binding SRPBCC domain-containing protein